MTDTSTVNDIFDLTVNNTNDPPVIGGVDTATVTEDVDPDLDTLLEAGNALTISDPDVGESSFQPATIGGTYGSLTIDAAGNWSYCSGQYPARVSSPWTPPRASATCITVSDRRRHHPRHHDHHRRGGGRARPWTT